MTSSRQNCFPFKHVQQFKVSVDALKKNLEWMFALTSLLATAFTRFRDSENKFVGVISSQLISLACTLFAGRLCCCCCHEGSKAMNVLP